MDGMDRMVRVMMRVRRAAHNIIDNHFAVDQDEVDPVQRQSVVECGKGNVVHANREGGGSGCDVDLKMLAPRHRHSAVLLL